MKKTYVKFQTKGLGKDAKQDLKGVHLRHPILPDDTLCCVAISDNNYRAESEESHEGRVTCEDCKAIIDYCRLTTVK